jgi:hypothetical protein
MADSMVHPSNVAALHQSLHHACRLMVFTRQSLLQCAAEQIMAWLKRNCLCILHLAYFEAAQSEAKHLPDFGIAKHVGGLADGPHKGELAAT